MRQAMNGVISFDVLLAYTHCRYKAYLKIANQEGLRSDYETALGELRAETRLRALQKLKVADPQVRTSLPLTDATLRKGYSTIIDGELAILGISARMDGVRKVPGNSNLGDFSYEPILFHEAPRADESQRALLSVLCLLLSYIQGKVPDRGVIYQGSEATPTSVRMSGRIRSAEMILDDLNLMRSGEMRPSLILNDHCGVCEFRQQCHEQAVREDNLSLLRGFKAKDIRVHGRRGILTLTQLAHTFRPRRDGKRAEQHATRRYYALQALAIRDRRIYVLGTPAVSSAYVGIFLDLEGNPYEGCVYLIGMIVAEGDQQTTHTFWGNTATDERSIFEAFLTVVGRYENPTLYCYGDYERAFIRRMRVHVRRKKLVDKILASLINVLSLIYAHFYFPTYSNGLKEIGGYLGQVWAEPNASAAQSIAWRIWWCRTHDDSWKAKLIAYNLQDCVALRAVLELLEKVSAETAASLDLASSDGGLLPISHVSELDQLAAYSARWERHRFVHPDYEFVNDRSYFDYQRQRIFIRTSKRLKKQVRQSGLQRNRHLRASCIALEATRCSKCGSNSLKQSDRFDGRSRRTRRVFDLILSSGAITRRVVDYRPVLSRCTRCGEPARPEQYERIAKYRHSLMSWATSLHVAYGLSTGVIGRLFEELFGIFIPRQEVHVFKTLMARRNRSTYQALMTKLTAGDVLHADETVVKLRSGKSYVWVFTNLEEVVFVRRPSREGEFLRDLLGSFAGVLVTDFYAAYDGLSCLQQKCLIHLIRDINQAILDAPFDQELQAIAQEFGALLRRVVTTVDDHGLKRRHLIRHHKEVTIFFELLGTATYRSEPARALQKRLIKYSDKLFAFIHRDGIPWNNSMAENAIKHFARYRKNTEGLMTDAGLDDYLVLLSIYVTCLYKGVSFLKFMLSGSKDIDSFRTGRGRRPPTHAIELYPKGFDSRGPIRRRKAGNAPRAQT